MQCRRRKKTPWCLVAGRWREEHAEQEQPLLPSCLRESLKPLEAGQQIPTPEGRGEVSESGGGNKRCFLGRGQARILGLGLEGSLPGGRGQGQGNTELQDTRTESCLCCKH